MATLVNELNKIIEKKEKRLLLIDNKLIDWSVLNEEILDAKHAIKILISADLSESEKIGKLEQEVFLGTTSGSIYDLLNKHFQYK